MRARHGLEAYLRRNGLRHRCSAVGVAASALCLRRHISASRVAQNGKQLSYQYSLVQFGRLTFWCSRQRCISQVSLPTNFRAAACLRAALPPSVSVPPSIPGCKGTGMWSTRPTALPGRPCCCLLPAVGALARPRPPASAPAPAGPAAPRRPVRAPASAAPRRAAARKATTDPRSEGPRVEGLARIKISEGPSEDGNWT